MPAKPYVRVTYHAYPTLREYAAAIKRHFAAQDVDFMDGIIHSPSKYVLSLGRVVDSAPYTHRYDWAKVHYRSTAVRQEDYLATAQYLFRYDRGVTNPTPRSALARVLFGKVMGSAQILRMAEKLHRFISADRPRVTVDLFIPFSRLERFFDWYGRAIGHFPLWVVPYRRVRDYEWIAPELFEAIHDELFVDLAISGLKQPPGRNLYREIEDALVELNGMKTLISYNFYDEDAFWRLFNRRNYLAVKRITDPENVFRDLYSKTCRTPLGLPDAPTPRELRAASRHAAAVHRS